MKTNFLSAVLVMTAFASSANADPILVGGQLTGFTDVDVNGTLYDVDFSDGTCVALFDGCDEAGDFTFQNFVDATAASSGVVKPGISG